jgi:hypothetical protein
VRIFPTLDLSREEKEMMGTLNTKEQIPTTTGIKRIMENMRVDWNEELRLLMERTSTWNLFYQ